MNSTEQRLRRAARAAADMFPPDGELPPLRLPKPTGSRTRLHTGAAHGEVTSRGLHVSSWLAPLAAAVAVMAVIAALVVPSHVAGKAGDAKPAKPTAGSSASASRQRQHRQQRELDMLVVEAVAPATGPQYDQGGRLIYMVRAKELRATARCMAASGYHISGKAAPYNLADFADNTQMPDLPRIARTHQFVGPGFVAGAYPAAEQKALTTCNAAATAVDDRLVAAESAINDAWWQIINRVQSSRQVNAAIPALSACATRYGYPNNPYGDATGPIKKFSDFMDWISGFLDGASSRGASQRTMNSLARHWTSVFIICATPIVDIYQGMLLRAQPVFLHRHAHQIAQLDKLAWRDLASYLK